MGAGFRLERGGRIDRTQTIDFSWNGRRMQAYAGDTLAAALLANGVRIVGRSFRFHRPRGVLTAGIEEPNALVTVDTGARREPSVRATMLGMHAGLTAQAQNCWPAVGFDFGRLFDVAAPLLPAGFYHRTFKWPSWRLYEGAIRRVAGLGQAPTEPDPDRYDATNVHVDLLVVGAGPAGIAAALTAARSGAQVLLVEQQDELGGHLLAERTRIDGVDGAAWAARAGETLRGYANATVLRATTAFGIYDHGVAGLLQRCREPGVRERYWRVRARSTLLATGAIEQPLIYEYNDLPGTMLAGAVRRYLNEHAVAVGRRIAVVTNNDSAYATALDLHDAGITVAALIDTRSSPAASLVDSLKSRDVLLVSGARPRRGIGGSRLRALTLEDAEGRIRQIACDSIAMSGGWSPAAHLFSHARGRLRFDAELCAFVAERGTAPLHIAGGVGGTWSVGAALEEGAAAARQACTALGYDPPSAERQPAVDELLTTSAVGPLSRSAHCRSSRCWVDFQHDVTVADLELAVREGYDRIELLKRYTTTGMSVDQGKTSNRNAVLVAAELTGCSAAELGMTTSRPPYSPVTLGALAGAQLGERFRPRRVLPAHAEHVAAGAHLQELGGWTRPACYPQDSETIVAAITREVLATRRGVGLFDASPLGKIEVHGADAAWFLDRFYVNNIATLEAGRVRYGIMLNEHGVVIDDGTVARLAADHFVITTTSGGAGRIAGWLEEWRQCEWPHREVIVTPVTTQWATLVVSGPRAREVLARLPSEIALAPDAFPHLQVRCGALAGAPARIYRVSFSGELGYEINVPSAYAAPLWQLLLEEGRALGIVPYGIESLLVMRLEKGFLHVGVDTDGSTIPADIGWGEIAARKPGDYIGKRSLRRAEMLRPDRLQLVGLAGEGPTMVAGAHLRLPGTRIGSDGWITSAASSPTLGRNVALAMLRGGRARMHERITVYDEERTGTAQVVPATFYDPANERLRS